MSDRAKSLARAVLLIIATLGGELAAQDSKSTTRQKTSDVPTVAVLAFESNLKEPAESGRLISEIISARLQIVGNLRILEREDIEKVLTEQKLALSGLVPQTKAAKVCELLGAKVLITGRVTVAGKRIYVICKAISSETTEVKGFFLSLSEDTSLDGILDKMNEKLAADLPKWAEELIPADERKPDDVAVLAELLKGKQPPGISIVIPERHVGPQVIDPAVETEFKELLSKAGVSPVVLSKSTADEVLKNLKEPAKLKNLLGDVRYLICGEAFSEKADDKVHGLTVCAARAEVHIIDLQTGKILLSDKETARSPDLSENLAAKTALQKAARNLAMRLLPELIRQFPDAPATQSEGGEKDE